MASGRREKSDKYSEAVRYMENASEILRTKAGKDNGYYQDPKYVKMASGTAYNAVLLALDAWLTSKGKPLETPRSGRRDVDGYRRRLGVLDRKILQLFNTTYNVLHLNGYYEGETNYNIIREGMKAASELIAKVKR